MNREDEYYGRMNSPTGAAWVTGLCGEEMEIYLYIIDGVIEDIRYYTEGCDHTRVCGRAVAEAAKGREIYEALRLNPAELIESEKLPEEGKHCAILAVSTLYRAIADYMLKP